MPDPHLLPAFVLATAVLMMIPGPNLAQIVANSVAYGARWGVLTVCATCSASMVQLALVGVGMAELVQHMGDWFAWVRWAGVVYLVALGVQQWRAPSSDLSGVRAQAPALGRLFGRAMAVALTNPKTLLFIAAFFPQFVSPDSPALPQWVVLGAIYLLIAFVLDCAWALASSRLRGVLGARPRLRNRVSGGVLIGAGLGLAIERAR